MKKAFNYCIYLLYFSTPFESVALFPNISIVKLVTIIFVLFALSRFKYISLKRSKFLTYFSFYLLFALISIAWSIEKGETLRSAYGTTLPTFVITVFILNGINNIKQINNIFKSYALGSILVAGYAFYMYLTGFRFLEYDDARVAVLGQDQNELGFLLTFGIISIIYLIKFGKLGFSLKLTGILSAILLSFIVLSTGSRTGFILLIVVGIVLILTSFKRIKIMWVLPFIIVISIFIFNNLPESISSRLNETLIQIENLDFNNRGYLWESALDAFYDSEKYILGTGHNTFITFMDHYYGWPIDGHNTFLITLIELGIIGFILYLNIIIYLCKKVWLLVKAESLFYSLLIIPLLLTMLTLGLENSRWLFLIGVLVIKLAELLKVTDIGFTGKKGIILLKNSKVSF